MTAATAIRSRPAGRGASWPRRRPLPRPRSSLPETSTVTATAPGLGAPEHRGRPQVEEARRLVVDLRLEGRVARAAEHDDHPERREAEEEHDRRRGRERGREERHRQPQPALRARRSERRRRIPQPPVEHRPERADDPHDHGDVEEDVREQDRPDRPLDPVGEEGDERGRDDDRGEDERHEHECLDDRPAPEPKPRERPRERQARDQRHCRRHGRLPEREPEDVARRVAREHSPRHVEAPVDDEAPSKDGDERPEEEDREGGERDGGRAPPDSAHDDLVHRATQRSRLASISSAGSRSGSFGTTAYFTNPRGVGRPTTGYTNIDPGTSAWKRSESMKSISFRAPSTLCAPRRTPAYSTWR